MEPIIIPIDGNLDLHTFDPKELPDLLRDYLAACREKGIMAVRVIHGKGTGVQKVRVRALLSKNPIVASFRDAPAEIGGWGATMVVLR
jgi:DNA-nicking Smr family endonuclease